MKRIVFFTLVSVLFSACQLRQSTGDAQKSPRKNIQTFIEDCISSVPNVNNNDVTRSILADTIKTRLQRCSGDTLAILSDLALEYEMSLKYERIFNTFESELDKNAGKYVVKFSLSSFAEDAPKSDVFSVALQVLTIMEKDDVAKLIDNGRYLVQGKFVDFANNTQETGFKLPSGKYLVDYPSVSIDVFDKEKIQINLGTLILEDIVFKEKK